MSISDFDCVYQGWSLCVWVVGCWSGWFDGTGVSEQADAAWCVSDLMFMQRSTDFFWFGIEVLDLPLTSCWQPFNRVPQVQGFTNYLYGRARDTHTLKNTAWSVLATCSGPNSTHKHVIYGGGSSLPCCQNPIMKRQKLFGGLILTLLIHTHTQTYRRWININIFKVSHPQSTLKGSVGALSVFHKSCLLGFQHIQAVKHSLWSLSFSFQVIVLSEFLKECVSLPASCSVFFRTVLILFI